MQRAELTVFNTSTVLRPANVIIKIKRESFYYVLVAYHDHISLPDGETE
jgi:hypothetical protein